MKKYNRNFTLVEMLTVVAIIAILAGIIIPTVIIAQNRGRITQAKTDISSIMTALKQVKTDYNRLLIKDGSNYYAGNVQASTETFTCSGGHTGSNTHTVAKMTGDAYNALIAELSAPKNSNLPAPGNTNFARCFNKRRKTYLDPKNGFNPAESYASTANLEKLWRDPWGSPYAVYLGVETSHEMKISGCSSVIPGDIAIYSFGPNGTDDKGCSSELNACINSSDSTNHKLHDDISSWNL